MFPPLKPLDETQRHGEEGAYAYEGKDDRDREQRRLLSLARHSRDQRKVSAPQVTKAPVILPNGDHNSRDAAEDQQR